MAIVDEILDRAKTCYGVNSLPWDRLFKGDNQQSEFFRKLIRERAEMQDALDIAAVSMRVMDGELSELRESVKASGVAAMELGAKRDPARD